MYRAGYSERIVLRRWASSLFTSAVLAGAGVVVAHEIANHEAHIAETYSSPTTFSDAYEHGRLDTAVEVDNRVALALGVIGCISLIGSAGFAIDVAVFRSQQRRSEEEAAASAATNEALNP